MRAMLFGVGAVLFVSSGVVSATGNKGHILSLSDQTIIRGAQLSDFKCTTNLATCDEYNFADQCETGGIAEGGWCLNCSNDTDVHDNCVQASTFTCNQYTGVKDCEDKVLGKCTGGVCSGIYMSLVETCGLDLNDCQ